MTSALLLAAAEQAEEHRELPIPAEAFGLTAIAIFTVLFAATWAFRFAATKQQSHGENSSGH